MITILIKFTYWKATKILFYIETAASFNLFLTTNEQIDKNVWCKHFSLVDFVGLSSSSFSDHLN